MTSQKDKGINSISYNYLDLPSSVIYNTSYIVRDPFGGEIERNVNTQYLYDADGTKLKTEYTSFHSKSQLEIKRITEYLDNFQYENGALQFTANEEGYYGFVQNRYIYTYKDHLGNLRLSYYKQTDGTAKVLEENHYYPFGLRHTGYTPVLSNNTFRYKYNGKEVQENGMYDYGARMYMPEIARWGVVDPLAEQYRAWSPYNYTVNNPISFIDPDGRSVQYANGNITYGGGSAVSLGALLIGQAQFQNAVGGSANDSYDSRSGGSDIVSFISSLGDSGGGDDGKLSPWMQANIGPGPKYTAQHYALIQGLSTFANKLFGIPFTLDKLTESEKEKIFKVSAKKTTAILMYEYASGTGPEHRNFYPGDALTEDIKWSNSSARATRMFADDYNIGKIKDGETVRYYVGSSPDKIGITGSVSAHLKGLADQSIWRGGMIYNMQKRGNKLYVNVFDKYTVSSGISRNDAEKILLL